MMKTNFEHTKKKKMSMKSRLGGKFPVLRIYRCYLSKNIFPLSLKRVKKLIERRFLL